MYRSRNLLLAFYGLMILLSIALLFKLRFTFDFEQFFPKGDPDWEFFKEFVSDFENDDNFLLVAVERKEGVFDSTFLSSFHDFTLKCADLPNITSVASLTKMQYPIKTPFGITAVPAIHMDAPEYYPTDRTRVLQDRRFVHNLITEDATAMTVLMKVTNKNTQEQAEQLMFSLDSLLGTYKFEQTHTLGRPCFQRDLVWMQKREVTVSTIIAALLAGGILFFIFRRWVTVAISMIGLGLALLFFLGIVSLLGRELSALAALYPVLMCIVGVADTIHITTKYIDELERGHDKMTAMRITLREIGLATFITCITTAMGFASLLTNRVEPIQDFGINAAIGVVTAFFVIYGWLWAILPRLDVHQLIKPTKEYAFWGRFMGWTYRFTRTRSRQIMLVAGGLLLVSLYGITKIHTNYRIKDNLPRGQKLTADFLYFERAFSGFRPLEFAVFRKMAAKQMNYGNRPDAYRLPDSIADFEAIQRMAAKIPTGAAEVLVSKDQSKARIAVRMRDMGRDSVVRYQGQIEDWWRRNTDSTVVKFKITGTGIVLDKNSMYVRDNMLMGLIPSVLIVALLMAFLFRDWRLVLIFTIPNVFPLFFAGALIGYLGIPLEAGIATVFSIVFGIATDDTIHFLSTLRICRGKGMDLETSIKTTLDETGKAMCLSSIILFFSFLVLFFSIHWPSVIVGMLVSITLAGALFCDLLLVPILVRWLLKDKKN
jgi:uncharacterized protein